MAIVNVLASAAIAMVVMGSPELSAGRQPTAPSQDPIRVVSNSHEVHFPEDVTFRLEAESDSAITQVTLNYNFAGRKVLAYGYPRFTPDESVSADFKLRTSGTSYVPVGVTIEYYYEIADASGYTLVTQTFSVDYRDPRYDWRELRQGDLLVLWHDLPEERVREVASEVERRLEPVKGVLGLDQIPVKTGVILSSRPEADRSFPRVSGAATRRHLYGGFAYGDFDLFVLAGLNVDGMVHEMTHLLMDEAVDSPLATVPAWLNEGLAMYFETRSGQRLATVEQAARNSTLLNLGSMNAVPGRPRDVRLFYAQAWSVVDYMVDTYGTERITSLLEVLNSGNRIDAAVQDVYGVSLQELEEQWVAKISGETPLAPRPDPGTAGTSFLIGGAVLIALLASAVGWLTRGASRSRRSET